MTGVLVAGGGGHAKVVIATLQAAGEAVEGVLDDDPAKLGQSILGVKVIGPLEELGRRPGVRAVLAVGGNRTREKLDRLHPGVAWVTAVHPGAIVHPSVELGPGTLVFAGAVIQPDARLGRHCIVNTGATVDHDCEIGDFAHLAPGSHLAGSITLEEGVFLGAGAIVIPGLRLGAWSTVGAGGVVIRDLPGGSTAIGVPARPLESRRRND